MLNNQQEFETKLAILADILEKKRSALENLLNICENQESLYSSTTAHDRREFVLEMGKEKQAHIDQVLHCDEAFQAIFEPLSPTFPEQGKHYPEQVKALQDSINTILELDVKIRAQEERTKIAAQAVWNKEGRSTTEPTLAHRNYILSQYQENNRNKPK
ncbi:MAG: hypothetical protein FWB98_03335 [Defluviitaleaceae bacterium]|nr:hypothetical protein [Defluviitaleaceae bacterium]